MGPAAGLTVSGGGLSRVFQVDNGVTATLSGLTLSGGSTTGNGGGLYNNGATLTLTDCSVSGNTALNGAGLYNNGGTTTLTSCGFSGDVASGYGGGLYNSVGTMTLSDCHFSGDSATFNGGGLDNDFGTATLNSCSFSGDSANANGGGLENEGGTSTLANCTFSGNSAVNGGALDNPRGTATLTHCGFSGDTASANGGGLFNSYGTTTLTNCDLSGEAATLNGGVLDNNGGTSTLTNCTVSGSSANNGGGLYNSYGTNTLMNCTVSGNSALANGGGLAGNGGTTALTNCTVSGNSAMEGGGSYNNGYGTTSLTDCTVAGNSAVNGGGLSSLDGSVTLGNTIVAENTATTSGPDALGILASQGNNLIGETDDSSGWVASDLIGTGAQPLNPVLAPLGNYGGPTQTMALLPGSPAIDAGDNSLIPSGVVTDQRGLPRIVHAIVDIGAFESSLFTITVISGSGQSTPVYTDSSAPLVATVTANNPIEPVAGGLVTFVPPAIEPAVAGAVSPTTIGADGVVTVPASTSPIVGYGIVLASANGITNPATFSSEQWDPTFSDLTSSTIVYGLTTTLCGHLGSGTAYPTGSVVSITIDSVTQTSTVDSSGNFTTTFDTTGLDVADGPYTVTYAFAGNPSFLDTEDTSTSLTVTPAPLTVAAIGVSRVYGASDPTLGVSYAGFVNGETFSVLSGQLSVVDSHSATTTSVGSYLGAITASGLTSSNYTITYVAGNLTVTPAPLTITANGASRLYGSLDPTLGVSYAGFVNGETFSVLSGQLSVVDSHSATTTSVGSYLGAITASGLSSSNYTITYVAGNLTVTPAALTITANSTTKTYGQVLTFAGNEFTTIGLINGDTVAGVSLSSTGATATAPVAGSPYAIIATNAVGSRLNNYTISYVAGSLTVFKTSPTITTTPNTSVVTMGTATTLTDTATLSGGQNETGTITFTLYAANGSTVLDRLAVSVNGDGTYTTPSYTLSAGATQGVYQWDATYNGDGNNSSAADNNDPSEQVWVVNSCCNLTGITYSVYNPTTGVTTTTSDLRGNSVQGDTVSARFTVPAGEYDQLSLVSYTAPESSFYTNDAYLQQVYQSITKVFGPGTYTLGPVTLPNSFYQVDFVCGSVLATLGLNSNDFYGAQNRLLSADNEGVNPVGSGVLSIAGEVYSDLNLNGKFDSNEPGLSGVKVTLTGTDLYGNSVSATATTDASGLYTFGGLPFSNSSGYAVIVSTPSGDSYGAARVGMVNGMADGTTTSSPEGVRGIVLGNSAQITGLGYNLGLVTPSDLAGGLASIVVLSPTASGALTISGNARVNVPGAIVVDSNSSIAISGSGTASLTASIFDAVGGFQKASGVTFGPAPNTGTSSLADPLAGLSTPSTGGLTNYGSINLTSGSRTINPGIYSSIKVSNGASLTLNAGLYVIEGGGFSVSGTANVFGSGVTIYNAGSYCPSRGGSYGSINWSTTGTFSLSAPSSGSYAGILIFQSRDNAQTLSINVSGRSGSAINGTIYAASAQLVNGGSTPLSGSLIVNLLTVNTGATADSLDAPNGGLAYTPAQVRSGYGINNIALDGTGQTIAIVDAYDDPSILQAVNAFDNQFGLTDSGPTLYNQYGPATSFLTVLNQDGQPTSLPMTDPNGPGVSNWEVEESLDVEWIHAVAPGARIVLVEANSQSLSDLMTAVASAAAQPGVSVVSMSWGFAEGRAVFAADEARYDSTFNVPGVTFVAATGDYGAADPEYPAFSPNVVAVGGTSLKLNADNSYQSETGWGGNSASAGGFVGSGGGLSLYEPEPGYQQGIQSTGSRTTPDVSFLADQATGAWIADPYNQGADNPFEVVGGTSLAAPAWAGLVALVNQGRAAASEAPLDSSSPTETQQALYSLPQSDYNVITSGFNGYTANAGYNLVTGLGTPVANLLIGDLIAYQGPGTTYSGPTVGALQDATLINLGSTGDGVNSVYSVFDAITLSNSGFVRAQGPGAASTLSPPMIGMTAQNVLESHSVVSPVTTHATTLGLAPGFLTQSAPGQTVGWATSSTSLGQTSESSTAVLPAPVQTGLGSRVTAWSSSHSVVSFPIDEWNPVVFSATDPDVFEGRIPSGSLLGEVYDAVLEELTAGSVRDPAQFGNGAIARPVLPTDGPTRDLIIGDPLRQEYPSATTASDAAEVAALGLAAGLWARVKSRVDDRKRRSVGLLSSGRSRNG